MVRWVGAFYSRVIKPQTFSEPMPLDWELHKCFLVSPALHDLPLIAGKTWLQLAEVEYFPFSGPSGSDETPAG